MSTHEARLTPHEAKSRTESKERKVETKNNASPMFDIMARSDLMLWPYRALSKALLRTQSDLTAFVEVNRKLADEMRDIVRREQDLVLDISEKLLTRATSAANGGTSPVIPSAELEEIYDSAVAGIRDLGKAVADAQIRSIESLRNHARSAMGHNGSGEHRSSHIV
jgi:hypothetical protein